ncbi:sugar ABC transporter permease, partial [Candidatus Aerophobetes bacterium]|nr:sugar ABC transporter permease [Candidatus Aerophobetes bacterium]
MKDWRVFPENKTALAVIAIGFAFLILFWWYPLSKTFILAFKEASLGSLEEPWVGLAHYRKLFSSKLFRTVVLNTLYFAGFTVPAQILLGLGVSSMIDRIKNVALKRLGILSFYIPYVLPIVAIGILWKFLYHPSRFGIF